MDHLLQKYGPAACIAGAAEGLGEAYSLTLARLGFRLVLVDRNADALHRLAGRLKTEYQTETELITGDLGDPHTIDRVIDALSVKDCRLLIVNAAFSVVRPFIKLQPWEIQKFSDVNCRAPLQLVHAFARQRIQQDDGGGILLMSSLAGLIGTGLVAPYSASKAFAWNLAEALHAELAPNGIDVTACLAGATATPTFLESRPQFGWPRPLVMDPMVVARQALCRLGKRSRFIPGRSNRINYFLLTRLLPRNWALALVNRTMRKMYRHAE